MLVSADILYTVLKSPLGKQTIKALRSLLHTKNTFVLLRVLFCTFITFSRVI